MCPPALFSPLLLDIKFREAEVDRRLRERWVAFDDDEERRRIEAQVFADFWGDPKYRAAMDRAISRFLA